MNETRRTRLWSWAFIAIGAALIVAAPILWLTGLSRATGVVLAIIGIVTVLLGLTLPHLSPGARTFMVAFLLTFLVASAITGICGFIFGYLLQKSTG